MRGLSRGRLMLVIAFVVLVAGSVVAVIGSRTAADAEEALAAANDRIAVGQAQVAAEEDRVAAAQDVLSVANDALAAAVADSATAESDVAAAEQTLARAAEDLATAEDTLDRARDAASAYFESTIRLVDEATAAVLLDDRFLQIRRDQQTAALAEDYEEVSRLQEELNELIDEANGLLRGFGRSFAALPSPEPDVNGIDFVGPMRLHSMSTLDIDPPTGPADVEATILEVIPCRTAGNNGCDYRVVITFTESNTLEATVNRLGVRWIERSGNRWWINQTGEFQDVTVVIGADGTVTHTLFFFTDADDRQRRVMGGRVRIRYNGTDAEGNRFRGDISARLERPPDPEV